MQKINQIKLVILEYNSKGYFFNLHLLKYFHYETGSNR